MGLEGLVENRWWLFTLTILLFATCQKSPITITSESILNIIPDSNRAKATPLVDFLLSELRQQYSCRIRLVRPDGDEIPFPENMGLSRDSLDRLFLTGWTVKIDTVSDQTILTPDLLADNVLRSLEIRNKYPWNQSIPDSIFRRYLLPYKVVHDYPESWWRFLTPYYRDSLNSFANQVDSTAVDFSQPEWLHYYTVAEPRGLPMWWSYSDHSARLTKYPSLSEQLTFPEGGCYLEAINNVRILRNCGLPATIDEVPYWGSKNGSHASDVFWDYTIQGFRAGRGRSFFNREEARRPAKVMRYTFHRTGKYDREVKPFIQDKFFPIPAMKQNYWLDATSDYTKTSDVKIPLDPEWIDRITIGYIYVKNYGKWVPVYYGRVIGNQLVFQEMGRDNIYRIGFRSEKRDSFITRPFLLDTVGRKIFSQPDFLNRKGLSVQKINHGKDANVEKGTEYTLQYLNEEGKWIDHQTKTCEISGELGFDQVPGNAFYILKSDGDVRRLARIFLIDKAGEQVWY